MPTGTLLAADLGASSGRVILARVGPDRLELEEIRRFRNGPIRLPDGLYWDILGLYQDILTGIGDAARRHDDIIGIGIDAWAVDYGLLDDRGALIGNPRHYRDDRTAAGVDAVHASISPGQLYEISGLQHLTFNTVYQLAADTTRLHQARRLLLIPDLLGYWLTGQQITEQSNASTTGLLDARTRDWSYDLLTRVGIDPALVAPVVPAGRFVGALTSDVCADAGLTRPIELTTVGSHDTASAVVGVPARTSNFAYISCGTWGLVGVELDKPVLTDAGRAANFSNELGVDDTVRYLRNVVGLWLLQESLRDWALGGLDVSLTSVLAAASRLPDGGPTIDADSTEFLAPGNMPARIAAACHRQGVTAPATPPEFARCILDSLADAFADAVRDAARLSGCDIEVVHIVGGGSQNQLLCQLTADALQLPVVAGPVEATAIGNVLVQARTHHILTGDLWSLRSLHRRTHHYPTYQPRPRHTD